MLAKLKQLLKSLLQSARPLIKRFAIYCKQTKLCPIGGIFLLCLMALIMLGCQSPQVITRCAVDRTLLAPIPLPVRPEKPTNGDLATSHRKLSEAVLLDNARKEKLDKQIMACQ